MQRHEPPRVSAESAYRAAVDRAKRGTEALIAAEAQILELAHLLELERERTGHLCEQLERFRDEPDAVPEDPEEEGVSESGSKEYDRATAVGEAVPAGDFSD